MQLIVHRLLFFANWIWKKSMNMFWNCVFLPKINEDNLSKIILIFHQFLILNVWLSIVITYKRFLKATLKNYLNHYHKSNLVIYLLKQLLVNVLFSFVIKPRNTGLECLTKLWKGSGDLYPLTSLLHFSNGEPTSQTMAEFQIVWRFGKALDISG